MRALKKSTKIWIIVIAVFLVLAVVGLSLVFGWINNYRFMTYTGAHFDMAVNYYKEHPLQFVAHRGLSGEAYQNTEKAFRLAAEYDGVWAVETDVWVTSDGGFVCMHDGNALSGVNDVSKITLEEALCTPLKDAPSTEYAPSLETFLTVCSEGGKVALIELKDKNMTEQAMDQLLERVHNIDAEVRIISFHFKLLNYIRSKDGEVGLWYIYNIDPSKDIPGKNRKAKLNTLIELKMDVALNGMFMKKSDVKAMHAGGRQVNVWTVDDTKTAIYFKYEFDVDCLTSNIRLADEVAKYL